jgi:hypothetical protein
MSEKRISEMSGEEFEAIVAAYIERESQNMGEINAPLFYEAIEEIFADKPETVPLEGRVIGTELQLETTTREMPGIQVHDNEIVVDNIRFVIRLKNHPNVQ